MPSYWTDPDHTPITSGEAIRLWADSAHDLLVEVASGYNQVVSAGELARRFQDSTGSRTDASPTEWYGRVLQQVIHRCHATGEPPLTALVINPRDGGVGVAYAEVLKLQGLAASNAVAREKHAAAARLDCYLRYAPDVPANAVPQLPPQAVRTTPAAARPAGSARTSRAPRPAPKPVAPDRPLTRICPTCFLETPLDGECQNCL